MQGKLGLKRRINAHKMAHIVKEHADEAMDELLCIKDVNGIAKKSKGAAIFFAVSFFLAFTFFIVPVHT